VKILAKYHSALDVTGAAGLFDFTPVNQIGSNDNWTRLNGQVFVSDTYIDLGGLSMDDKTIFPSGITVQRGSISQMRDGSAGDSYLVMDVLTSIPIDVSPLNFDVVNWFNLGVGWPGTTLNWEHVLYARCQRWTLDLDTGAGFPLKADEWQMGSMSPTASDRVYSYRVVLLTPQPQSGISRYISSSARHVLEVDVKEEPEYEYLMRLKRSYDLQQEPDVD